MDNADNNKALTLMSKYAKELYDVLKGNSVSVCTPSVKDIGSGGFSITFGLPVIDGRGLLHSHEQLNYLIDYYNKTIKLHSLLLKRELGESFNVYDFDVVIKGIHNNEIFISLGRKD